MTLTDIFEVTWDITELYITAREEDLTFIHQWIYAPDPGLSIHQKYDIADGKLTVIEKRINVHGKDTRGGPEMAWGVETKAIHKELITAPVSLLMMLPRSQGRGTCCRVDVIMDRQMAKAVAERDKAEPPEDET